jgi:hypothetical protein
MTTDKHGNILQSTDIILIETNKGNKLAKILSIFDETLTARIIKENKYGVINESKKSFSINIKKYQDSISLYEIKDTFSKSNGNVSTLVEDIIKKTRNDDGDQYNTSMPYIKLDEMRQLGIDTTGRMTDDQKITYNKKRINNLIVEAVKFTRGVNDMQFINSKLTELVKLTK